MKEALEYFKNKDVPCTIVTTLGVFNDCTVFKISDEGIVFFKCHQKNDKALVIGETFIPLELVVMVTAVTSLTKYNV
jgi:hypothetical protein